MTNCLEKLFLIIFAVQIHGLVVQWIPACQRGGHLLRQAGNRSFLIMFFVYAIKSEKDGRFYVGFTNNLERRILEHNQGKTKSTKGYVPWVLVYRETVDAMEIARKREKYLKSGIGKKIIKEYIQ